MTQSSSIVGITADVQMRLDAALDAGEIGTWIWDIENDRVYADRQLAYFFNVSEEQANGGPIESYLSAVHPDDLSRVSDTIAAVLDGGGEFEADYRVMTRGGERWLAARGRVECNEAGQPVRFPGIVLDITQRKIAEMTLRTARERLDFAIEAAELGTFYCPMPMGAIIWNTKCKELFWLPPDAEVNFDKFYAILHPDDRLRTRQAVERAIFDRQSYDIEYRTVSPEGNVRWVRAKGRGFYDVGGEATRFDGIAFDITERKLAAEELERQQRELRRLSRRLSFLDDLGDAMRELTEPESVLRVATMRLGRYLKVSRCAYADVDADENRFHIHHDYTDGCGSTVGHYDLDAFGGDVGRKLREGKVLVLRDVAAELGEEEGRPTFEAIGIRAIITCPLIKGGKLVALMAVHQTEPRAWTEDEIELMQEVAERSWSYIERARAGRAVMESEERFRSLVWASALIVWQADPEGALFGDMSTWCRYTGQSSAEALGWGWLDVLHPEDRELVETTWRKAVGDKERFRIVYRVLTAEDEYRRVQAIGVPLTDGDGEIREWVGTLSDVEDRLILDEQREDLLEVERAARAEAERTSRMKDEFLATLSHELRTPLNAILGWSQVLQARPAGPDDLRQGLATIERNARAQAQIIEDLLDMSRIISGKVMLDVQRLDLASLVDTAVQTVRPAADAKGIQLHVTYDMAIPPLNGDPNRLQQVFWNLLSNAIKFTPRDGEIFFKLEKRGQNVEIRLTDTGEGIDESFLPHVFDRFRQADATTTRRHGGLGLGLAIVKQLVELHGGSVEVMSEGHGHGTTFFIKLPFNASTEGEAIPSGTPAVVPLPERHVLPPKILKGVNVLVVDDEEDARVLVQKLLMDYGASVRIAAGVPEAITALESELGDVLISDISMPGEDGYALIRQLMERKWPLPAVALTAYARSEDRTRTLQAGFQRHLAKPVDAVTLITTVAEVVGRPVA